MKNAHDFYKQYKQDQHARETLEYRRQIKAELAQIKGQIKSTSDAKKFFNSPIHSKNKLQKNHFESPNSDEQANFISFTSSRKRKIDSDNEEKPVPKLMKTFIAKPIIRKSIEKEKVSEVSCSSISISNNEKELQHKEEELKKILNQIAIDDPFRFYGQLFFNLNQQLHIDSKESFNHTLLTQLSWLTLSQQLISLIPNKNQNDSEDLRKIEDIRIKILEKYKKNLNIISQQKRNEAYPTYESSNLRSRNLQTLLIKEIFDYYYGLEAFKQTSTALFFLDLTTQVIKNYNFNLFKEIKKTIQSTYKSNENLFHAKLLRELVKFHVCEKNIAWQESIFSSESKVNLNKEYLRILTIAENFTDQSNRESLDLRNKIKLLKNHLLKQFEPNLIPAKHSSNSFFQPAQSAFSIDRLIEILQEHFQCLLKNKKIHVLSQDIYKHLIRFIPIVLEGAKLGEEKIKLC